MLILKIIGCIVLAGFIFRLAGAFAMNAEARKSAAKSHRAPESDEQSRP